MIDDDDDWWIVDVSKEKMPTGRCHFLPRRSWWRNSLHRSPRLLSRFHIRSVFNCVSMSPSLVQYREPSLHVCLTFFSVSLFFLLPFCCQPSKSSVVRFPNEFGILFRKEVEKERCLCLKDWWGRTLIKAGCSRSSLRFWDKFGFHIWLNGITGWNRKQSKRKLQL